jgi:hypothetical protein
MPSIASTHIRKPWTVAAPRSNTMPTRDATMPPSKSAIRRLTAA